MAASPSTNGPSPNPQSLVPFASIPYNVTTVQNKAVYAARTDAELCKIRSEMHFRNTAGGVEADSPFPCPLPHPLAERQECHLEGCPRRGSQTLRSPGEQLEAEQSQNVTDDHASPISMYLCLICRNEQHPFLRSHLNMYEEQVHERERERGVCVCVRASDTAE